MKAVTWQARRHVKTVSVPDPVLEHPTDAIIKVTSSAICGSDLHLYEVLGPYMDPGDILGHEPMGIVEQVGSAVTHVVPGDRVVVPFNISCGHCWMCQRGLQSQCETTQGKDYGTGASLLGFSKLYGHVPGGQAQFLRVPHANYGLIKVASDLPDERFLFLSDILPTAWQGVKYADVKKGDSLAVMGLGPVGQFAARIGKYLGAEVHAIDPEPVRRHMAERYGVITHDLGDTGIDEIRDATNGRGVDAVVDAVGMEAHGHPAATTAQKVSNIVPGRLGRKLIETVGIDRAGALYSAIAIVRRGGAVSLSGVYGGSATPMPLLTMFDKQIQFRMGQCNVRSWNDVLMPIVTEPEDPLGVTDLVTHRVSIDDAAEAYEMFQKKTDGCVKVVIKPND